MKKHKIFSVILNALGLIIFSISFTPVCFSQNISKWKSGSAKELRGKIYVLSCFISESHDRWSKDQKIQILSETNKGMNWISAQSKKYGVDLNFQYGCFGIDEDIEFNGIERGGATGREDNLVIEKVLRKAGYTSSLNFYNWVLSNTDCDQVHVLIFVKGNGNGYAMPYSTDMGDYNFVEGAILYEKDPIISGSIAHETLHLYGAWDLYHNFSQSVEKEESARRMLPGSIMLEITRNINNSNIDELTSWLIGWNRTQKNWYMWFKPTVY